MAIDDHGSVDDRDGRTLTREHPASREHRTVIERVVRTGGRWRWLVAAAVLIVLALVAVFAVTAIKGAFAPQTTEQDSGVLLQHIQDMKVFRGATGNFQVVVDLQTGQQYVPKELIGQRTLFVAAGTVDAEIDLSGLGPKSVATADAGKTITLTVPHATLAPAHLDEAHSYVADTNKGILSQIGDLFGGKPDDQRQIRMLAEQRLTDAANQSELPARAEGNARDVLTSLMSAAGFTTVTVNFGAPAP
jgi:hypothetical protein